MNASLSTSASHSAPAPAPAIAPLPPMSRGLIARRKFSNGAMGALCGLATLLALIPLALVLSYVVIKGLSVLSPEFFTTIQKSPTDGGGGMKHSILGTLLLVGIASCIGLPFGILGGIYLSEFGGNRLGFAMRFAADVLNGVPSIIVGLFVYAIAVLPVTKATNGQVTFSAWAGGLALGIMMIPTIMRTTEEIVRLVPMALREGRPRAGRYALALGVRDRVGLGQGRRGDGRFAGDCAHFGRDRAPAVHRALQQLPQPQPRATDRFVARHHLSVCDLALRELAEFGLGRRAGAGDADHGALARRALLHAQQRFRLIRVWPGVGRALGFPPPPALSRNGGGRGVGVKPNARPTPYRVRPNPRKGKLPSTNPQPQGSPGSPRFLIMNTAPSPANASANGNGNAPAIAPSTSMAESPVQTKDPASASPDQPPGVVKMASRDLDLFYGPKQALKQVNAEFTERTITALIGPSGCGKSTYLRCLNRMNDLIDSCKISGEVSIDGQNIYQRGVDVVQLRQRVGMVFQKPNPFPMSIFDNIAYGPRLRGIKRKDDLIEIVEQSLKGAALWDEVKDDLKKSALGLSGGQQQRLCIARTMATRPEVILMDEPCSALDPISTLKVEELMRELRAHYTLIIVTHNMQQAARCSDRTGFFLLGELVELGESGKMFTKPTDSRTEDYITGRFG